MAEANAVQKQLTVGKRQRLGSSALQLPRRSLGWRRPQFLCVPRSLIGDITMAKSLDSKKDKKKAPLKSPKEKKAEKAAKKAAK
jgi:hypothetical protein